MVLIIVKNILSLHHDPVGQWIEFKIPVLTMKVRILSGSQCGVAVIYCDASSMYELMLNN